jgi:hypothetical protein
MAWRCSRVVSARDHEGLSAADITVKLEFAGEHAQKLVALLDRDRGG